MSPLSVLVVDISIAWEEELKALERGYYIHQDFLGGGRYKLADWWKPYHRPLQYPYGSARAGFDAIIDTIRVAHECKVPIYSVDKLDQWSDGDEDVCYSLQPYIPKENRYFKYGYSAFKSKEFTERFERDKSEQLLVVGYDRDVCALDSIKDAVAKEIKVITSEHCMLTVGLDDNSRERSIAYYKENTIFLNSLIDVWNYIRDASQSSK